MKSPAFQFYAGDWLRAPDLRMCSSAARGLWIDMIAIMHQAEPYGHLVFNGRPVDVKQLSKMVGESINSVTKSLNDLKMSGVYSVDDNGIIYCRRMVRDHLQRVAWREQQQAHRDRLKAASQPDVSPDVRPLSAALSAPHQVDVKPICSLQSSVKDQTHVLPDGFARFWGTWPSSPRKVGKAKCLQVWRRLKLDTLQDVILTHVEALKVTKQWRDGFEPAPLTYLNGRRWEDGLPEPPPPRKRELAV